MQPLGPAAEVTSVAAMQYASLIKLHWRLSKPLRISTRLFLYVFGVIVALGVALGYVSVRDERAHLLSETRTRAWLFARTVAAVLKHYHPLGPAVNVETILAEVAADDPAAVPSLRLYGPDGSPLSLSCATCQAIPPIPHPSLIPDELSPEGREDTVILGRESYLQVLQPVLTSGGAFQGAVEVILPLHHVGQALAGVVRRFLLFGSAGLMALGAVLLLIARWGIAAPLQRLQEVARDLGAGDLSLRLEPSGVADIDELIAEFNRMAKGIEEQNLRREQSHRHRIELERGLRHTDKLASIGQLTSGLAHELGTPLNVISGRAEQMMARLSPDDPSGKALETVVRQTGHIAGIIDRLLAFSRKGQSRFAEVDIGALVQEAFTLCRLRMKKAGAEVKLECDLDAEANRLYGDADALQQLFVNLMLNSLQVLKGPGGIRIRARTETGDRVRIDYEDTGAGIPPEHWERVFDPFFTTKEVGEGTGLGLYIVARVVEEHGGEIRAGAGSGGGARFTVTLPRGLAELGVTSPIGEPTSAAGGRG
jgi:signal transduction histidine kinase